MKVLPESIGNGFRENWLPWVPMALGAARVASRLRDFFEVDAKHIVLATLDALAREKKINERVGKRGDKKRFRDWESIPKRGTPRLASAQALEVYRTRVFLKTGARAF